MNNCLAHTARRRIKGGLVVRRRREKECRAGQRDLINEFLTQDASMENAGIALACRSRAAY